MPLTKNQFLHKGATLKDSDRVLGLVVYTGSDTKVALNLCKYRFKMSRLEKVTNIIVFINIAIMLLFSLVLAFMNYGFAASHLDHEYMFYGIDSAGGLSAASFFSFWLILNSLIPLELPVMMEISKFITTFFMQNDGSMVRIDTMTGRINQLRCNTLNLHEELGEVEYMFCDKTGTLT